MTASSYGSRISPSGPSCRMTRGAIRGLVSLAAHRLHEDREVQLSPARDGEGVGRLGGLDAEGDVPLQFTEEALAELSRCHIFSGPAREGSVVDPEVGRQGGPFDGDPAHPLPVAGVGHRLADLDPLEPRQRHDVAGARAGDFDPLQPLEAVDPQDAGRDRLVGRHRPRLSERKQRDEIAFGDRATVDAADRDAPDVGGMVERRGEHLERSRGIAARRRDGRDDRPEQGFQIPAARLDLLRRPPFAPARIEEGCVQLGLCGVEFK